MKCIELKTFFECVFREANPELLKPVYKKVKEFAKSMKTELPTGEFSQDYFNTKLKPGVPSILGCTVFMGDGGAHGKYELFHKLQFRRREKFLHSIKELIEQPAFIYSLAIVDEDSEKDSEKFQTDVYVRCYDDVNKKGQKTVIWVVGIVRKYEDGDFLISVYDRSEEQVRNQFIESEKVFSSSTKSWTIT